MLLLAEEAEATSSLDQIYESIYLLFVKIVVSTSLFHVSKVELRLTTDKYDISNSQLYLHIWRIDW